MTGKESIILFYKHQIKKLDKKILATDRRDPKRNDLYMQRKILLTKLADFEKHHGDISESSIPKDYGVW